MENPAESSKPLIMIVDDNPEFINGLELTLEMEGYQVISATNGQIALERLQSAFKAQLQEDFSGRRLPDLILADIMMPVMDGYDFYQRVRTNPYLNHIPFIFTTAKSTADEIRYGKELGADDYLAKPFLPEDLLAVVRGKLKRAQQQRSLATRFIGDTSKPTGAVVFAVIFIVLIFLAFILGLLWNLF